MVSSKGDSRLARIPGEVCGASQPDRGYRRGGAVWRGLGNASDCRACGQPQVGRRRLGGRRSWPGGAVDAPVAVRGQHLPRRARFRGSAHRPAAAPALRRAGLRGVEPGGDRGGGLVGDRGDPVLAGMGGGARRGGRRRPARRLGGRGGRRSGGLDVQARPPGGDRGPGRGWPGRGQAQRALPHDRARHDRGVRLRGPQHRSPRADRVLAAGTRPRPGRLRGRRGRHHLVHVLRHRAGERQRDGRHGGRGAGRDNPARRHRRGFPR